MFNFTKENPIISALIATLLMVPLVLGMFLTLEPAVTLGQGPGPYDITVTQEISDEISFSVAPQDVTMDDAIAGVTGGEANGSTTFAITTNNSLGYTVTIAFASTTAMEFNDGPEYIPNLGSTVIPDFNATAVSGTSGFGYTITGPEVISRLLGNTTSCGSGSAQSDACWELTTDATSATTIVDSSNASDAGGDSYDLYFRVVVDGNPNPALPEGFYTATATLTATNNS